MLAREDLGEERGHERSVQYLPVEQFQQQWLDESRRQGSLPVLVGTHPPCSVPSPDRFESVPTSEHEYMKKVKSYVLQQDHSCVYPFQLIQRFRIFHITVISVSSASVRAIRARAIATSSISVGAFSPKMHSEQRLPTWPLPSPVCDGLTSGVKAPRHAPPTPRNTPPGIRI